jgi:hypothetical protein
MVIDLPRYLNSKAVYFWECFNGVVSNSLFHIYDVKVKKLHNSWNICVSNGQHYFSIQSDYTVFSNPGDASLDIYQQNAWETIDSTRLSLKKTQSKLLEIIRTQYLEINIDEMSTSTWCEYIEARHSIEKQFQQNKT